MWQMSTETECLIGCMAMVAALRACSYILGQSNWSFQTTAIVTSVAGSVSGNTAGGESSFVGDVNGDGRGDWVHGFDTGSSTSFAVYLGNANGTFQTTPVNTTVAASYAGGWANNGTEASALADVNGDGREDWVHGYDVGSSTSFVVLLGKTDGTFQTPAIVTTASGSASGNSFGGESSFVGDVNGDGRGDWVHGYDVGSGTSFVVLLGKTDGTFQTPSVITSVAASVAGSGGNYEGSILVDVNSDTRADWVHGQYTVGANTGWDVYLGQSNGAFSTTSNVASLFLPDQWQ